MAKKTILVSDLSGDDIDDGDEVEVRVLEYPGLNQRVRLDASKVETDRLRLEASPMALLELVMSDGTTERIALSAELFAGSIKGDPDEVMAHAEPVYVPQQRHEPEAPRQQRRARGTATATATEKIDYTDPSFAGRVKRGIISDGEKQAIRDNFDLVNQNLEAAGQRQIDLTDIAMVSKYGLEELAAERGITPKAQ